MVILLVAVSACQEGRQNYLVNGIGTELSGPNLAGAESLQNRYFGYLCRQAYPNYQAGTTCNVGDWNLIAYQGMNDIDRRCDSYLQWLDNRKRSRGPWVSQIGDTAAATAAILPAVGASTKAITIVAQAFQLVTKSVENYHSRLLLEVESSTVNSIVLQARHNFRKYLIEQNSRATNKPEAEYILRSYTRLCLPFAIEAKVNDYSTLGSLGQAPEAAGTHADMPVVGGVPITSQTRVFRPNRDTGSNNSITLERISSTIQAALCVHGDGVVGVQTTEAIRAYQFVTRQPETGTLEPRQKDLIINQYGGAGASSGSGDFGPCSPDFANFLERSKFLNNADNPAALADLRDDLRSLAQTHGAAVEISDTDTLAMLRPKIRLIKQKIGGSTFQSGELAFLNSQYTPDLERLLLN